MGRCAFAVAGGGGLADSCLVVGVVAAAVAGTGRSGLRGGVTSAVVLVGESLLLPH